MSQPGLDMVLAGLMSSSANNGSRTDTGLGRSVLSTQSSETSSFLGTECDDDVTREVTI